mmetsp:Transcript_20178/g.55885  ORF Transcript_20178/g.55885 Transcript_20178/m.55885 type:complete len:750 (-) Transcript_20178:97-2346(-)
MSGADESCENPAWQPGVPAPRLAEVLERLMSRKRACRSRLDSLCDVPVAVGAAIHGGEAEWELVEITPCCSDSQPGGPIAHALDLSNEITVSVEYRDSWDDTLQSLLDLSDRFDVASSACLLVADRLGRHVDLGCPPADAPPRDRFPLCARIVAASGSLPSATRIWPLAVDMNVGPGSGHQRCLARVPPTLRWQLWRWALLAYESEELKRCDYAELSRQEHRWSQTIKNDVSRSLVEDAEQQQRLQRVLDAYAAHNPVVGYCQGMNLVAGLLLRVSACETEAGEEDVFRVFACLMDGFGLGEYFREGLPLLQRHMRACSTYMEVSEPGFCQYLNEHGMCMDMMFQKWLLSLFIDCLPLNAVVVVWDAIFCEGLAVIPRFAIALLRGLRDPLQAMPPEDVTASLRAMQHSAEEDGDQTAVLAGQLLLLEVTRADAPCAMAELVEEQPMQPEGLERRQSHGGSSEVSPGLVVKGFLAIRGGDGWLRLSSATEEGGLVVGGMLTRAFFGCRPTSAGVAVPTAVAMGSTVGVASAVAVAMTEAAAAAMAAEAVAASAAGAAAAMGPVGWAGLFAISGVVAAAVKSRCMVIYVSNLRSDPVTLLGVSELVGQVEAPRVIPPCSTGVVKLVGSRYRCEVVYAAMGSGANDVFSIQGHCPGMLGWHCFGVRASLGTKVDSWETRRRERLFEAWGHWRHNPCEAVVHLKSSQNSEHQRLREVATSNIQHARRTGATCMVNPLQQELPAALASCTEVS